MSAYITFGRDSVRPANGISNLYFFTWGSFGIACSLAASDLYGLFGSFMGGGAAEEADKKDEKEEEAPGDEEEMDAPSDDLAVAEA